MKDILVDQEGNMRCPKCKGRNFDIGRTKKNKIVGFATVAWDSSLLTRKRSA